MCALAMCSICYCRNSHAWRLPLPPHHHHLRRRARQPHERAEADFPSYSGSAWWKQAMATKCVWSLSLCCCPSYKGPSHTSHTIVPFSFFSFSLLPPSFLPIFFAHSPCSSLSFIGNGTVLVLFRSCLLRWNAKSTAHCSEEARRLGEDGQGLGDGEGEDGEEEMEQADATQAMDILRVSHPT